MKKIILFLLLISIFSCEMNNQAEKKLETLSHENGLVISVDKNINKINITTAGFKMNLAAEGARAINELEVKKSINIPSDLSSYETKTVEGLAYQFKLESVSEGSGGDEYTYRIWKPTKGGGILLEHYIQQETKPVFEQDWEIIQGSNIETVQN